MKKRSKGMLAGVMLASSALLFAGCKKTEEPRELLPINGCVYGPPPYFEEDATPSPQPEATPETTATPDAFDPETNIPADVYGPPSYWGGEDEQGTDPAEEGQKEPEATSDPFEPEENLPPLVYGPPAYFEE